MIYTLLIRRKRPVQCVSIITEVINYYVNQNSCVYMCMLDASVKHLIELIY